ncbi:MAG: class II glutamine amidotransferase [Acutalibacteraceae bacterium]|nr:class II glutamine amidotransferase [Acutalibacteraceae bacterium]
MCCLFGIVDYQNNLTPRQLNRITAVLSRACEARGTDATGIAYNWNDNLKIYKQPVPAHKMKYQIPFGVHTIMGHTRMTTQGDEKQNYNNHPFYGNASNTDFALAHNGVLHNDIILRATEELPNTTIETDSYIAVQLIEKKETLDTDSLKYMAEQLEGSFTITVLDQKDNLYFIKGDNPMCIYHFKSKGIYIYASTEEILLKALKKMPYRFGNYEKIDVASGEILKIDKHGKTSKTYFDDSNLIDYSYYPRTFRFAQTNDDEYLDTLKSIATTYGISENYIDCLLEEGFTTDDIEELIYCY